MDFATASKISFGFIILATILIPMWITFLPPRPIEVRTVWLRPVIAIAGTMAALYSFYFVVLIPYGHWLMEKNPMLYSGIFRWHPHRSWAFCAVVVLLMFAILMISRYIIRLRYGSLPRFDRKAQQGSDGKPDPPLS